MFEGGSTIYFQNGDTVQIISNCYSKGKKGSVIGYAAPFPNGCQYVIVRLHNHKVNNYNPSSLQLISRSLNNQLNKETENIIMDNFMVASIKFLDGTNTNRTYYYALYDDFYVGDKVVVKTGHHGFAIAEIVNISNDSRNKVECGREVVCRIDFTAYENRIVKAKRLAELKGRMNEKVKELQKTAIYEMLAEKDESLKALLDEYKGLLDENIA